MRESGGEPFIASEGRVFNHISELLREGCIWNVCLPSPSSKTSLFPHSRRYFQIMLIFSLFFLHQLCVVLCNLQRGAKSQVPRLWCELCEGGLLRETDDDSENVRTRDGIWHGQIRLGKQTRLSDPVSPARTRQLVPYLETLERCGHCTIENLAGQGGHSI